MRLSASRVLVSTGCRGQAAFPSGLRQLTARSRVCIRLHKQAIPLKSPAAPAAALGAQAAAVGTGGRMATAAAGTGVPTTDSRVLCSSFLDDGKSFSAEQQLAVVLLNWTLPELTPRLWHKATVRVCADGGANRLYDELPSMLPGEAEEEVRAQYLPTVIKGDLDSIRPAVLRFYQDRGVRIVDLSADQDSTDLQKCINFIRQQAVEQHLKLEHLTLVALGALGGRLDHTLSNLSTLHAHPDLNLVLLGDGNLARLVPAGRSTIRPHRQLEGPTCGLVPLIGPVTASSSGLRWNLECTEMRFGGLVSTSNLIEADEVQVESDGDLIWTTHLRHG